MPDARVDEAVGEVDQQVHGHDHDAEQQGPALEHRVVAAEDGLNQPFANNLLIQ